MTPPPLPGRCPCLSSRTCDCVTSRGKKAAADVVKVQEFAVGRRLDSVVRQLYHGILSKQSVRSFSQTGM